MKLHFKVKRSLAVDCTHRGQKVSVLSSAKHKAETSDVGEIRPQTEACAEPMHLKLKLRGHLGGTWVLEHRPGGAFYPPRTQPQEKLGNTHKGRITKTRKVAVIWTCQSICVVCPSISKTCEGQVLSEQISKHGKSYSRL